MVTINASKGLTLNCNGTYIKLTDGNIEIGGKQNLIIKMAQIQKAPAGSLPLTMPTLPEGNSYSSRYHLVDDNNNPLSNTAYTFKADGQTLSGYSDDEGKTLTVFTRDAQPAELYPVTSEAKQQDTAYHLEQSTPYTLSMDYYSVGKQG